MKSIIIILFSAVLLHGTAFAQEKAEPTIPSVVLKAFQAKFPKVTKPTWEVEKPNEYEAEFTQNGTAWSVKFDANGKWLETENDIKTTELPNVVTQSIAKNFAAFKITEAGKVESLQHGNCYEVEIQKGKESVDVLLTASGEVLSKEIETEETDDDN